MPKARVTCVNGVAACAARCVPARGVGSGGRGPPQAGHRIRSGTAARLPATRSSGTPLLPATTWLDLYQAQLNCFLDPDDPEARAAAEESGIPHDWITAARRSPVYDLISRYRVALPLHPEYRTMPMVWYIPPLSPVVESLTATGHDGEDPAALFAAIDSLRIPLGYLAELFTAGDTEPVEASLCRLAAMRSHMRRVNLGEEQDPAIARAVGMTGDEIEAMYRLLALAKYDERYVVPTSYTATTPGTDDLDGCSLDGTGGPGMYDAGTFHTPPAATAAQSGQTGSPLRGRVNLLNWNGRGRPDGLFPRRKGQQA